MKQDPLKKQQGDSSKKNTKRGGFSLGFWSTIILFATVVGFAQWKISTWFEHEVIALSEEVLEQKASSQEEPLHTVELPPEVRIKRRLLTLTFQEGEERFKKIHQELSTEIKNEFIHIRGESDGLVRQWADWYYSVTGEYTRLIKLLLAAAGKKSLEGAKQAASDYMATQVKVQLIDPINADQRVEDLEKRLSARLQTVHTNVLQKLQSQMKQLEEEAEQQGRVHADDLALLRSHEKDLAELTQLNVVSPIALATKALSVGSTKLLISGGLKTGAKIASQAGVKAGAKAGSSLGTKAGLKVGQAVAAKVAGKGLIKSALAIWGKMLVKFGIKTTAKGGGAAAAATSGTVACSFLGPWAFACGVAAGTAAWFAVDKVVVEVDELLNRDRFEAELRKDLQSSWNEIEHELQVALDAHFYRIQLLMRSQTKDEPVKKTTLMKVLQRSELGDQVEDQPTASPSQVSPIPSPSSPTQSQGTK